MASTTLSPFFKPCIPTIHITPSDDGCSDGSSSSSDEESNTDRTIHKQKVVRPPFRPSRPNRSKSAPLPSDDEDSSEDDSPVRQIDQPSTFHQPCNAMPSRKAPQRPRAMSDDFQQTTPRRLHRPIPPPLTHVQSSQSLAYFVYPTVPRYIPAAHCSMYPQHRKPTLMPKAAQMPGYRRAKHVESLNHRGCP
ncbi:hypothetical protein K450DRAFT_234263 [Umbelopsis ramanniana AG]|uniref:Uncharacterized protein n=1 Tax=Umbelopsis ramanniana AG TaxID=1314678 RepID=A0AAD5EBR8_UMBRA|nr:uncharacterized protein K450DRAFT_234263 [Umbelopsis ramanniana AG]KAI8581023.1 hypothetical protein K450DRAFT_234263 [Umbelopsis ramanniana AG]